jgi:hypothetical protein
MTQHIFFSWQSDVPNGVGRSFIEACLGQAIGEVIADTDVELADRDLALDKDTLNEPGSPSIAETIFGKIDNAAIFLADMTYVAARPNGTKSPNPNVLIEHGWAMKSLGSRRVLAVMNTAYGDPQNDHLPFDLRYARWPIRFNLAKGSNAETRKTAKSQLIKTFKAALKTIFEDPVVQEQLKLRPPAEAIPADVRLLRRFRKLLPERSLLFLREQNFGEVMRRSRLDPFYEIAEDWKGAAFEFHDAEVQQLFANILARNAEFAELAATYLHASRANDKVLTIKTDYDLSHGRQESTLKAASALDNKATELVELIDAFERIAKDRLRAADEEEGLDADQIQKAEGALQTLAMDGIKGGYHEIVPRPRLSLRVAPLGAVNGRRIDPHVAASIQQKFRYDEREAVRDDTDGTQWWVCKEPTPTANGNPETKWRMRMVRPGYFEFQYNFGQRIDDDPLIVVDGIDLERTIVGNLDRMFEFARELAFEGGAVIAVAFEGMSDVELRQGRRKFGRDDIVFPSITVPDLSDRVASALHEQLDIFWQMAGAKEGSPSFQDGLWTGYRRE